MRQVASDGVAMKPLYKLATLLFFLLAATTSAKARDKSPVGDWNKRALGQFNSLNQFQIDLLPQQLTVQQLFDLVGWGQPAEIPVFIFYHADGWLSSREKRFPQENAFYGYYVFIELTKEKDAKVLFICKNPDSAKFKYGTSWSVEIGKSIEHPEIRYIKNLYDNQIIVWPRSLKGKRARDRNPLAAKAPLETVK